MDLLGHFPVRLCTCPVARQEPHNSMGEADVARPRAYNLFARIVLCLVRCFHILMFGVYRASVGASDSQACSMPLSGKCERSQEYIRSAKEMAKSE